MPVPDHILKTKDESVCGNWAQKVIALMGEEIMRKRGKSSKTFRMQINGSKIIYSYLMFIDSLEAYLMQDLSDLYLNYPN